MNHLDYLEAEAIHVFREVASECNAPVLLYSIGKDSAVLLHLAKKAFSPGPIPFPLLHVDTTWKFRDMYTLRDKVAAQADVDLLIYVDEEAQRRQINPFDHGAALHTDLWKTKGLKSALDLYGFDAAFGGARRDEEKSRAKERICSFRREGHQWDPRLQRPELWNLYNLAKKDRESFRVFPISNWTELDVWQYILQESIELPSLYFAALRPVVMRDGMMIMVDDDRFRLNANEIPILKSVRFRTLGCYPLSGAVESSAATLVEVIEEIVSTSTSERFGRSIDHDVPSSMELKKRDGYF